VAISIRPPNNSIIRDILKFVNDLDIVKTKLEPASFMPAGSLLLTIALVFFCTPEVFLS